MVDVSRVYSYEDIVDPHQALFVREHDTNCLPSKDQLSFWQQYSRNVGKITNALSNFNGFSARVVEYITPKITISHNEVNTPSRFERSRKTIANHSADVLVTQIRVRGREIASSFGDTLLSPGDIRIIDMQQPFWTLTPECENINIIVPKSYLTDRFPSLDKLHGVVIEKTPMTNILATFMRSAIDTLSVSSSMEALKIIESTLSLLEGVLLTEFKTNRILSASDSVVALSYIQTYIAQNYRNPKLSPSDIANYLGVSRSKLFLLCKADRGPMELLRHYRLKIARESLLTGKIASISHLAYEVGYSNVETFSRSFKKKFGQSPRDLMVSKVS